MKIKHILVTVAAVLFLRGWSYGASSVTILPDYGLNILSTTTVEFININPGEGSGFQLGLLVVSSSLTPWHLNLKSEPFKLVGSPTTVLPSEKVTYRVYTNDPCTQLLSAYTLPQSSTTIYTAKLGEYATTGTTVSLNINLAPEKGTKLGRYTSRLYVEVGDLK